jgi:hypothetical protein
VSPRENVDTPCGGGGGGCLWFPVFGSPSASHHPILVHSHRKKLVEENARTIASVARWQCSGLEGFLTALNLGSFRRVKTIFMFGVASRSPENTPNAVLDGLRIGDFRYSFGGVATS